jgi:Zn-dependent metalloprotease
MSQCHCFIIPPDVLKRLSEDPDLTDEERQRYAEMVRLERYLRRSRALNTPAAALAARSLSAQKAVAAKPSITVYDCRHGTTLPGAPVSKPGSATDATAQRAFNETTAVAEFLRTAFGRNSVDNLGMTLQSSIHYGVKYNNAFWNGTQMTYGDGDGSIFLDFTASTDVIAHELAHGLTQFTARLGYTNEAGGLNESVSDVFGSMFRQWRRQQTVDQADWLIGADIMGPTAKARGYACLRDMARPDAAHCLSPQPTHYRQYRTGMDPHESSGIPNLAFQRAARAIGGTSWTRAGRIWYAALTAYAASPAMKMKTFANRTREQAKKLFPTEPAVATAVDQAWAGVGL